MTNDVYKYMDKDVKNLYLKTGKKTSEVAEFILLLSNVI